MCRLDKLGNRCKQVQQGCQNAHKMAFNVLYNFSMLIIKDEMIFMIFFSAQVINRY